MIKLRYTVFALSVVASLFHQININQARASYSEFYVFGHGGLISISDSELTLKSRETGKLTGSEVDATIDLDYDSGFSAGGGLGYTVWEGVGVEIDVDYRSTDGDIKHGRLQGGTQLNREQLHTLLGDGFGADTRAVSVTVGGSYTIGEGPLRPLLGANVGWSRLSVKGNKDEGKQGLRLDDSEDGLTYQIKLGLGFAVSEEIEITSDYRYTVLASRTVKATTKTGEEVRLEYDPGIHHGMNIGLRLKF